MTRLSQQAWAETSGLRRRILDLPFNRELAEGTLSDERFRFYILQDALYLAEYARALALAAARSPDVGAVVRFAKAAEGAIMVERRLHEGFFAKFGIGREEVAQTEPSPTCFGYTNFLLAVAQTGSYEALIAAILPCFWVYWEVGNDIARRARPDNPYRAWIDTYADPVFGAAVESVIAIVDHAAAEAANGTRAEMMNTFRRSTQFEWMFWDSGYRRERWPVEV